MPPLCSGSVAFQRLSLGRVAGLCLAVLAGSSAWAQGNVPPELFDDPHVREELGVNDYTAPSIDRVFRELQALRPIPYDRVKGPIDTGATFPTRFQLALNLGLLLGEGFLTVESERSDRIAELGRALLRMSQALGISDRITRHSKSLMEEGLSGNWPVMRRELAATQHDVEAAIMDLRDEEIAHVVALGGWLRGLEIASITVAERYTPERAALLRRIDLIEYFNDRVDTLHPHLRRLPVVTRLTSDLKTLQAILDKPGSDTLDLGDVRQIRDLTAGLVRAMRATGKADEPAAP